MTTLGILADIHELTQAKARYCLAVDSKDWAALAELMVPNVEFDVTDGGSGVPVIKGRDEAIELIRISLTGAVTAHQVHTPLIDFDGDVGLVIWAMQDRIIWDNGVSLTGYGHYHERWERRDGEWKLTSLTLTRLIIETASEPARAAKSLR